LADVGPRLLEAESLVYVADEHFDVVATFVPRGLDVVLEDVLPYPISILRSSRRVTREKPSILTQPAPPVGEPVMGILGVRHQDSVILPTVAGVLPHFPQTLPKRFEPVSFPRFVEVLIRHAERGKTPFDGSDRICA